MRTKNPKSYNCTPIIASPPCTNPPIGHRSSWSEFKPSLLSPGQADILGLCTSRTPEGALPLLPVHSPSDFPGTPEDVPRVSESFCGWCHAPLSSKVQRKEAGKGWSHVVDFIAFYFLGEAELQGRRGYHSSLLRTLLGTLQERHS